MFNPVRLTKSQVFVDVGPDFIRVEYHGIEARGYCIRERRLACPG
jgi:hypothetical protein